MTIDLGEAYRAARLRISGLLSDDIAEHPVPACPAWNVHDVTAHLAGVAEDVANGNVEGAATDPWTAAQVERGRDKSITQLLGEWAAAAPGFESFLSSPTGAAANAAVFDIHTHEADIRSALGMAAELPADVVAWAGAAMRESFQSRVAVAGLPEVSVDTSDFEMFRGRLGRRTRAEVCAYSWSVDPAPYLDAFFIFGPTDQSIGER
jgi:uncharacterized protein (TIGR03083 family)